MIIDGGNAYDADDTGWIPVELSAGVVGTVAYRKKKDFIFVRVDVTLTGFATGGALRQLSPAGSIPTMYRPDDFTAGHALLDAGYVGSTHISTDGQVNASQQSGADRTSIDSLITYPSSH